MISQENRVWIGYKLAIPADPMVIFPAKQNRIMPSASLEKNVFLGKRLYNAVINLLVDLVIKDQVDKK